LDALPTKYLRDSVRNTIERHMPEEELRTLKQVETEEKKAFIEMADKIGEPLKSKDVRPRGTIQRAS